ncbi:MAG: serine/threonine protein kinase [Deltaproteobacteria bacterium]|nr:serine/threonine protein kinase [Deltaproteobacteria bacterium]
MRFGPFEIVRPLGRGGMAETFLARRTSHDGFAREICLKRVLPERAAEPDFVSGFQREAKLAARLVHPHIAQVYDFGSEGDTYWMTLEHVPGGDLRALLKALGQPMPADLGLVLMVDMLEALGYAHELGIVHRDVSPSNILLDLQGNFKLADFGIAKARHVDRDGTTAYSTTTGTIKGKAAYMAPEQALGLEVDGRADLWSFGVVMFEAFSSKKPFEGPTDLAIMMAANQGRRPSLAEVAPHVPADVRDVIERLLTPNRDERFQSAGDVLEALSNHPAPVRARKRLAAMLQSIGASRASEDAAQPTVIETAPSFTDEASIAPPPAADTPITTTPITTTPITTTPITTTPITTARPEQATLVSAPSPSRRWLVALGVAASLGAVIAVALVVTQSLPPDAPTSPRATRTTSTGTSVIAAPPTTTTVAPAPPIARGVLVPDLDELPPVPDEAAGSRVSPRGGGNPSSGSGSRVPAPAREVGSLHVTVIPWGDVTVDGTSRGRSPITIPLTAGAHRVRIESESGAVTREVSIEAGEREELEVDLSDG